MTSPLLPERHVGGASDGQGELPLAAEGVQRIVCRLRYGEILIEVVGDRIFVNGEAVEPASANLARAGSVSVSDNAQQDDMVRRSLTSPD